MPAALARVRPDQVGTVQQLHHQEQVPLVAAGVVHDGDAGVLQTRERRRLLLEPARRRRVRRRLVQHLDRYVAVRNAQPRHVPGTDRRLGDEGGMVVGVYRPRGRPGYDGY